MIGILESPWVPCGVLFGLALIARSIQGSWLAPSVFPALVWSAYVVCPLVILRDIVSPMTIWIIVLFVSSAQLGAFFSESAMVASSVNIEKRKQLSGVFTSRALRLALIFSAIALVGSVLFVRTAFEVTDSPFSWDGFWSLGAVMYGVTIAGDAQPWWFRLMRIWAFPAVVLGGMAFVTASSWRKKSLGLLGLIPTLVMGLTLASRFATALALTCWVASYLGMKTIWNRGSVRFRKSVWLAGAGVFVAALVMYIALGILRGNEVDSTESAYSYVASNIFGYLVVFDNFVKSSAINHHSYGLYSLGGALELLGLAPRETAQGYEPVTLVGGATTNIFTAFRGLIEDFSYPGAVLVLTIVGILAGWAYTNTCRGKINQLPVLVAYYSFFLWSPINSAFYYNSTILGLLAAWIFIRQQGVRPHVAST